MQPLTVPSRMKLHLYVAKSKVLQSSSSSSSSLVLDKMLTPEDEDEKYQIQSAESAPIWNCKVSSTIKLVSSAACSGAEPRTLNL